MWKGLNNVVELFCIIMHSNQYKMHMVFSLPWNGEKEEGEDGKIGGKFRHLVATSACSVIRSLKLRHVDRGQYLDG